MKKHRLIILLILVTSWTSWAQEELKFVSKLEAKSAFGKIQLSWSVPPDFADYLTVYRHTGVIDSIGQLKNAKKVKVLKNLETGYIDIPPAGFYYYAVLITAKENGRDYKVLIPFRNYTLKPVELEKQKTYELISIQATSNIDTIDIAWDYTSDTTEDKNVLIYRNTIPIVSDEILEESIKIGVKSIHDLKYTDIPAPNIHYYYALFLENSKLKTYSPGINITLEPAHTTKKIEHIDNFSIDSFIPLPLLTFKHDPKSGKNFLDAYVLNIPKKVEYTERTKEIIKKYRKLHDQVQENHQKDLQQNIKHLDFHLLNDEAVFETEDYKEEYTAGLSYIENGKYDEALKILNKLVTESLPDDLFIRICYYIGSIHYNKGNFYQAYIYLNVSYESYKDEVKPYLESIYHNIFNSIWNVKP